MADRYHDKRIINPVAVFLACGAEQIHPKLPGLDSDKVIMASNVTIIDMLPQLGQGMYPVIFMDIMKQLNPHAPVLMPGHKIEGLNGNTLKLTEVATGKEVCIEVDNVVLAMGNRPDKAFVSEFEAAFDRVIVLGENRETPGRIATSISDGYTSAYGFDPFV